MLSYAIKFEYHVREAWPDAAEAFWRWMQSGANRSPAQFPC